ncbi:MAG: tRNA (adenosine(37)-N6)-dimethylallyltransferase MiaA, partial [Pedobacter sp.]
ISPIVIGLQSEIAYRRERILARLNFRLENGLIEEVENLLAIGVPAETLIFYGLEYKFVVAYLNKEMSYSELEEKLGVAICQYAKRQMTFFRKMEKDGVDINWLSTEEGESALLNKTLEIIRQKKSLAKFS